MMTPVGPGNVERRCPHRTFHPRECPPALRALAAHHPSITDADEGEMDLRIYRGRTSGMGWELSDLALRTCSCGVQVDGFDAYVAHLEDVL